MLTMTVVVVTSTSIDIIAWCKESTNGNNNSDSGTSNISSGGNTKGVNTEVGMDEWISGSKLSPKTIDNNKRRRQGGLDSFDLKRPLLDGPKVVR